MHKRSLRLGSAAVILLMACNEDNLRRDAPILNLRAYTDANTNYVVETETAPITINLGEVPVYATRKARYVMDNPSNQDLSVYTVTYAPDSTGATWMPASCSKNAADLAERVFSREQPCVVPSFEQRILNIPYSPAAEGPAMTVAEIASNAENGQVQSVKVLALGIYQGAPDIEIEFNGIQGPRAVDCVDVDGDTQIEGCIMAQPLDFGGVGLGSQGSARLFIRNTATCPQYPGAGACETCVLTVDADPRRVGIGLGFKPGTNTEGYFSFAGSTATPFTLAQSEAGCTNFVRPVINFDAPTTEGTFTATVIVESNDPDEPSIEIPISASAVNAPIAIAKFRAFDPGNPAAPWTDSLEIEPYDRVYVDGRAMGLATTSHDPRDPARADLIAGYRWVVFGPDGVDPAQYAMNGALSGLMDFFVPLAGHYTAKLTVTNDAGLPSLETEISQVSFEAVPRDAIHVQLVWDDPSNDQDLHLNYVNQDDRICNQPWDCHWLNKQPNWFGGTVGAGANPTLDVDDTNGLGPENINIEDPNSGVYRVTVHYYGDSNFAGGTPTACTVRIFLNGLQVAEYRRTLTPEKVIWAVADITWQTDSTGFVTPYPSDTAGEVGTVANMQDCSSPGFSMP